MEKVELLVSVIIPTLNASQYIAPLLTRLAEQTRKPDEVLVVDSESDDDTIFQAGQFPFVRVISIKRAEFDHGATRDMALRASIGDIVLFMTQDVLPADTQYVAHMVSAVMQNRVACVCARQIARADAPLYEKLTREFNYPADSFIRSKGDIAHLGIKAFFMSDAGSAYRKADYFAVGGFDHPILTNEDMMIAAKFLRAGYRISYCAEAMTYHSHNYTLKQEYRRNFNIGAAMEEYKERLGSVNARVEGFRYIRFVIDHLFRQRAFRQSARFMALCLAKFFGNRDGKRSQRKRAKETGSASTAA